MALRRTFIWAPVVSPDRSSFRSLKPKQAAAVAAYRPSNRTLTAVIISQGLAVTGANIREAAAGATGPLVVRLTESAAGSGIWIVRATLTTTQAEALNNGAMYYELLSSTFPEGELRGQIVKTQGPTATATPATPATPAAPAAPATPATPTTTTAPTTIPSTQTTVEATSTGTTTPSTGTTGTAGTSTTGTGAADTTSAIGTPS